MKRGKAADKLLAVVLLAELALLAFVVVQAWPAPNVQVIPEAEPALLVLQDGEAVVLDDVQGTVDLVVLQASSAPELYVITATGERSLLGTGDVAWDTTARANGPYTLEAEIDGEVIARTQVTLLNARASAATAAAVVGTTTAVAAGGSAVGSSLASRAAIAAAQIGKESLMAVGEDHLALRTASRKRMASGLALGLTLLLVFLFFPFEGLSAYLPGEYLAAIPIAGGVSVAFVALALGSEALLGVMSRATTRLRFLTSGAVSLILSSIVFRTPFGYPGYVEEIRDEDHDGTDDEPPHVEGIRALAGLTVLLTLLMPFLWIGYRFNYAIADQAMEIALVGIATSALPVRPLPGYDIWVWRRSIAVAYCVSAFMLYFGWVLAFLPTRILFPLGVIGLALYTATLIWLRARSRTPQPAWYVDAVRTAHDIQAAWRAMTPQKVYAAVRRVGQGAAKATDAAVATMSRLAQVAVRPISAVAGRLQDRRMLAAARAREEAYLDDLAMELLDQLAGLDDDAVFMLIGPDGEPRNHPVGDLRDRSLRRGLLAAWGGKPPKTVTVIDDGEARRVNLR